MISGNGYITFDISQANQYSPFSINTPIPNPGSLPENAIMAPWHDLNPSIGGNVTYSSYGIAQIRIFIVTWCAFHVLYSIITYLSKLYYMKEVIK